MTKNNASNIIGDKGEAIVRLLISEIAFVDKIEHDQGLDFHCKLRGREEVEFYVQAKGAEFPEYDEFNVTSLPIEIKTIENKWLKKSQPVFVIMVDTRTRDVFFLHLTQHNCSSLNTKPGQKTVQFKIPLANRIDESNIGEAFLHIVVQNQPYSQNRNIDELNDFLENYKITHSYLFHELDEIETYLELLRSPDQNNQLKAQQIIFNKYKRGRDYPHRLIEGSLNIFKNSNDRILQIRSLQILTNYSLDKYKIVPEILKQIERTLASYNFWESGYFHKHHQVDFLFDALISFKAKNIYQHIRKYLDYNTDYLTREVLKVVKGLGIKEASEDCINLMYYGKRVPVDKIIREEACQALSKIKINKKTTDKLIKECFTSNNPLKRASIVYYLTLTRNDCLIGQIETLIDCSYPEVKLEVKLYVLAYIEQLSLVEDKKELILKLALDTDNEVSQEATSLYINSTVFSIDEKRCYGTILMENILVNEDMQKYLLAIRLLFAFHNIDTAKKLVPVFKAIRAESKRRPGDLFYISLKCDLGQVLLNYDLPCIYEDIVEEIKLNITNISFLPHFINAIGNFRISTGFDTLIEQLELLDSYESSFTISALIKLDMHRACSYARAKLNNGKINVEQFIKYVRVIFYEGLKEQQEDSVYANHITYLLSIVENQNYRPFLMIIAVLCPNAAYFYFIKNIFDCDDAELFHCKLAIIGKVKRPECKQVLLEILDNPSYSSFYASVLEYLAGYKDDASFMVIKKFQFYPHEDVRSVVRRILLNYSH